VSTSSVDQDKRLSRRSKVGKARGGGRKVSVSEDGDDSSPLINKRVRKRSESGAHTAAVTGSNSTVTG